MLPDSRPAIRLLWPSRMKLRILKLPAFRFLWALTGILFKWDVENLTSDCINLFWFHFWVDCRLSKLMKLLWERACLWGNQSNHFTWSGLSIHSGSPTVVFRTLPRYFPFHSFTVVTNIIWKEDDHKRSNQYFQDGLIPKLSFCNSYLGIYSLQVPAPWDWICNHNHNAFVVQRSFSPLGLAPYGTPTQLVRSFLFLTF